MKRLIAVLLVLLYNTNNICLLQTNGHALRPPAAVNAEVKPEAKSSSSGEGEVDPYELEPLSSRPDDKTSKYEDGSDDSELLRALSGSKKKKDLIAFDEKIKKRQVDRGDRKPDKEIAAADAEASEADAMKRSESDFLKFWEKQTGGEITPAVEGLSVEMASPLGEAKALGGHIETITAISDIKGASKEERGKNIDRVLAGLQEEDAKALYYKALGYLYYAIKIGCDESDTARIFEELFKYKDVIDMDDQSAQSSLGQLRVVIADILELISHVTIPDEEEKAERRKNVEAIRQALSNVAEPGKLIEILKNSLKTLNTLKYDRAELRRIRDAAVANRTDAVKLKELILQALKFIEISDEPGAIRLPKESAGQLQKPAEVIFDKAESQQMAGITRSRSQINNYMAKWKRRIREPVRGEKRIVDKHYSYLLRDAREIALLAESTTYMDFYPIPIDKLQMFEIVKLRRTHGAQSKVYVVIATTGRGGCTLLDIYNISNTVELRRDSDVTVKALNLKGIEAGGKLKNHIDVTFTPGSSFAASAIRRIIYSHTLLEEVDISA